MRFLTRSGMSASANGRNDGKEVGRLIPTRKARTAMPPRDDRKPETASILAHLKDFQRATVEYVFHRMYLDKDYVHRFLVADEVGLGKTLVARGIIAKAIDHLWDRNQRIDIVYVCSNADIARQNIS